MDYAAALNAIGAPDPEENAAKFRGDYYLTGDKAFRDEDGYFWFVGRSDDVILSGGYRIGPFEIESAPGQGAHLRAEISSAVWSGG